MKRFLIIVIAFALIFSMAGCGGRDSLRTQRERYDYEMGYSDYDPDAEFWDDEDFEDEEWYDEEEYVEEEEEPGDEEYIEDEEEDLTEEETPVEEEPDTEEEETTEEEVTEEDTGDTANDATTDSQEAASGDAQTDTTTQTEATDTSTVTDAVAENGGDEQEDEPIEEEDDSAKFKIGETWSVPGNWSLTIKSVIPTPLSMLSGDSPYHPAAIYLVEYEYRNEGLRESDGSERDIIIYLDDVTDSEGFAGYDCDLEVGYEPEYVLPGESCSAQIYIGLDHDGPFDITVFDYDNDDNDQEAIFHITP